MGRVLLSICAVVVALGIGGLQQPDQSRSDDRKEAVSGAKAATPVVSPSQDNPNVEDPGCQRDQDDRRSDLCAQWKAADAARSSADAAWWLGVLGVVIGGLTLLAASRAAHWAKEAAEHTKRSADVAEAAHRPFLQFGKLSITYSVQILPGVEMGMIMVAGEIANLGASHAFYFASRAMCSDKLPTPENSSVSRRTGSGHPLLLPGDTVPLPDIAGLSTDKDVTDKMLKRSGDGMEQFYVATEIYYGDDRGNIRKAKGLYTHRLIEGRDELVRTGGPGHWSDESITQAEFDAFLAEPF